ncbi:MAG TPA: hypothetical protein VGM23_18675, partial [Armatimonadota bacterium]
EEQWAYHQARWDPSTLDREQAYQERLADMRERFTVAAEGGRSPIVHCEVPTNDYPRPLRYTPHPFETIKLLKAIAGLGADKLSAWGRINPAELVPWDVNLAAMKAINADIDADPAQLVRRIAVDWVGEDYADVLVQVWEKGDRAITRRPLWSHSFSGNHFALPGPLVPDLGALQPAECAYYRTLAMDDLEQINGLGFFLPFEPEERVRGYVLNTLYRGETLRLFEEALALLTAAIAQAPAPVAEVLRNQYDHIQVAYLWQRSHANWYEAAHYLLPGEGSGDYRALPEIIDDEIGVTEALIALLAGRAECFLTVAHTDMLLETPGPGFVDRLRQRIPIMRTHRNDPPQPLTERLQKVLGYTKTL